MDARVETEVEWFAVQTKPGAEALARQTLARLELETFLPQARRNTSRHGRRPPRISALFPGYCFARFQPDLHLRAVRGARGVVRVVGSAEHPWAVDEAIIEDLRARLDESGLVTLEARPFRHGEPVRIDAGPLEGWTGVFDSELDDRTRVVILLHAIQQARVVVDRECVESAERN